jgi:hypothetical protein
MRPAWRLLFCAGRRVGLDGSLLREGGWAVSLPIRTRSIKFKGRAMIARFGLQILIAGPLVGHRVSAGGWSGQWNRKEACDQS